MRSCMHTVRTVGFTSVSLRMAHPSGTPTAAAMSHSSPTIITPPDAHDIAGRDLSNEEPANKSRANTSTYKPANVSDEPVAWPYQIRKITESGTMCRYAANAPTTTVGTTAEKSSHKGSAVAAASCESSGATQK